jgi:parallel beta-helix repeat protein
MVWCESVKNYSIQKVVLVLFLASMLLLTSSTLASGGAFKNEVVGGEQDHMGPAKPFLNDTFENDTLASVPSNWNIFGPNYSFIVDNSTAYSGNRSARFFANSTLGTPIAYRYFEEQKGLTVVILALKLVEVNENFTGVEIYIDDDHFNGSNIVFSSDMKIQYREPGGKLVPIRDKYSLDKWYKIEFVMNIPKKFYQIHLDDHLEIVNAKYTGPIDSVHRIAIRGSSASGNSTAYIDQFVGYGCVRVPDDFPTIQEAVDAAFPGQGVYVSPGRVYFESVVIRKSLELIGSDNFSARALIDGHFNLSQEGYTNGITIAAKLPSDPTVTDVQIHGFIVQNSNADGIYVKGSNISIYDNVILNSRDNGTHVVGNNVIVRNNTISNSSKIGVYLEGSNCTVKQNIVSLNLWGIKCESHIKVPARENLIYNNTIIGNTYQSLPESDELLANRWTSSYPATLGGEGGGNYWGDFNSNDVYSGVNQDQPGPDGICDTVRGNQSRGAIYGQDNYPSFLIQNTSRNPSVVSYGNTVVISGQDLRSVPNQSGFLYVNSTLDGNLTYETFRLIFVGSNWNATIPAKNYSTEVRYYASVHAQCAVWANSTIYQYRVGDTVPPNMSSLTVRPPQPDVGQLFNVSVVVTEPPRASGVDQVLLSWLDNASGTLLNGTMKLGVNNTYSMIVPKQFDNQTIRFTAYAYDKAGNVNNSSSSITINSLANMFLLYNNVPCNDPFNLDFEVLSKGPTYTKSVVISDTGMEPLDWNLSVTKGGSWLTASPTNGTILPGRSINLIITVNTAALQEPVNWAGELSLRANGSKPAWGIITVAKVRWVVIDQSVGTSLSAKSERADIGSVQNYSYHAIWGQDSSDVVSGSLTIAKVGVVSINNTGWANWSYNVSSSGSAAEISFPVSNATLTYIDHINPTTSKTYTITGPAAFVQKAPVLDTIWDRVNVTISIPRNRIDVGMEANPTMNASYEFDGKHFPGAIWLSPTSYAEVGLHNITAIRIEDPLYNLTAFKSKTVQCIWDRVRILGGGVSSPTVNAGEKGTFWVIATYEYDNQMLKGGLPAVVRMGQLFVNVSDGDNVPIFNGVPLNWSSENDRWEYTVAFDSSGTRTFVVSGADDYQFKLTEARDSVGPLSVTWGPAYHYWWTPQPAQPKPANGSNLIEWQQSGLVSPEIAPQLSIMIVGVLLVACVSVVVLWSLGINRTKRKRRSSM